MIGTKKEMEQSAKAHNRPSRTREAWDIQEEIQKTMTTKATGLRIEQMMGGEE